MTADEDGELVGRFQAGDPTAFEPLVERYHRKMYDLALRHVRDTDTALDVTQDAFVRAFRELPTARLAGEFHTWLSQLVIEEAGKRIHGSARPAPESNP